MDVATGAYSILQEDTATNSSYRAFFKKRTETANFYDASARTAEIFPKTHTPTSNSSKFGWEDL